MVPPGLSWSLAWAMLVALCHARPTPNLRRHLEGTALLEEKTQISSSANLRSKLRGSSMAVEDAAPDDVASLRQEITKLKADKKGLLFTVRRLLKANQTEAQKKIVSALRRVKLTEQAEEKELKETENKDAVQINKLQLLLKMAEQQKKAQPAAPPVKQQDAVWNQKVLEKAVVLKEQNKQLLDEKTGLEATVKKLWNVSAAAETKSMLKVLGKEEDKLKLLNNTRQVEEKQFAQEKNGLVKKLEGVEHKHDEDALAVKTAMEKLQSENQQLRASLQELRANASSENQQLRASLRNQTTLEAGSKVAAGLREESLEATLSEEKTNSSKDLQAAGIAKSVLEARLLKDETEKKRLQQANAELESTVNNRSKELEVVKLSKDADENAFTQEITDLQKKLNDTETLQPKQMKLYMEKRDKEERALQDKMATEIEAKFQAEAKASKLSVAVKEKDDELSKRESEEASMEKEFKMEEAKLAYAVEKENTEMLDVDRLNGTKADLEGKLQKLEPEFTKVQKEDEDMKAVNKELAAREKHESEQLLKAQHEEERAKEKVVQEQSKLDFVVGEENTQELAVNILQSKSQKLEASVENQTNTITDLEAQLFRLKADNSAKDTTIKSLQTLNDNDQSRMTGLQAQVGLLTHKNEELQATITKGNKKFDAVADREETTSIAMDVVQSNNQKLKEELNSMTDEEVNMEKMAKVNEAKAVKTDDLSAQDAEMKKDLEAMRDREEALQHKNDDLQETVVTMVTKRRDYHVGHKEEAAQTDAVQADQAESPQVPEENGLEKANAELSKLETQLKQEHKAKLLTKSTTVDLESMDAPVDVEAIDA